jgi:serine/threonine protein phosphatase PrpC
MSDAPKPAPVEPTSVPSTPADATLAEATPAEPVAVVQERPIVPATWQAVAPEAPWCPPEIGAHAPAWLRDVVAADVASESAVVAAPWRVAAASVRGRSHAHRGDHREDAFAVASDDGLVVLCAADGAGSSRYSRIGAEYACRETAAAVVRKLAPERAYLRERHRDELVHAVGHAIGLSVWETCRGLHDLAKASTTSPADYRCTLLVAALYRAADEEILVTSQVGDGAIIAWRDDDAVVRLGTADSGDYAGEVRTFVPDAQAPERASHVRVLGGRGVRALALLTDGVDDPLHPLEAHAPAMFAQWRDGSDVPLDGVTQTFRGPVLGDANAGTRLAEWLTFEKRGENDDRTAVVLHRA